MSAASAIKPDQFTNFGDLLRYLRRRAGLTQRELSIAVGYSDAQISRLEQNLRLPDVATVGARFVPALGLDEVPEASARLLELATTMRRDDLPASGPPPYKGLRYFDEADAEVFFGREALSARLLQRVLAPQAAGSARFLGLVGASGSGKSSLLRAGLIPALRACPASARWSIHSLIPTARPLQALALTLTRGDEPVTATVALADSLARDSRALHFMALRLTGQREDQPPGHAQSTAGDGTARPRKGEHLTPGHRHLLLVVDQFEEVFTLCRDEAERAAFVDNLMWAAGEPDGPTHVVLGLRADFYAHCAPYADLRAALASQQEFLGPMQTADLRRAIEEPARRGGWELEAGLVEVLLKDVGAEGTSAPEPGALPLLSHALLETWERRRGRRLTLSGYLASGGVRGAIAETAEAVFQDRLDEGQRAIARRIFLRLTEFADDAATADTRRRAALAELLPQGQEASEERRATQAVLQVLADARLITLTQTTAEVAHEAVLHEWPTLREWLHENREGLRLHRRLTEAAQAWEKSNRDPSELFRGARLARALEWAAWSRQAEMLDERERQFLQASGEQLAREEAEREAQRRRELEAAQRLAQAEKARAEEQTRAALRLRARNRVLTGIGAIALALALAAGFFGVQANRNALRAERQSNLVLARQLVQDGNRLVNGEDYDLAGLLGVEALRRADSMDARSLLLTLLQGYPPIPHTLLGHAEPVNSVAFSPDGQVLASAGDGGAILLWDTATYQPIEPPLAGRVTADYADIAFSADGKLLASATKDQAVIFWDLATHQPLGQPLTGFARIGYGTGALSPDGRLLAVTGAGNTISLWDVPTRQPAGPPLVGHRGTVSRVAFSPDGKTLASASFDNTIILWDLATRQPIGPPLAGHGVPVNDVVYSPDGRRLASADVAGVILLWDAATGRRIGQPLVGPRGFVSTVAFSPDGNLLVSGGFDGAVRLWDTATGQPIGRPLTGHTGAISRVAFSPDGRTVAASGWHDRSVIVWDVAARQSLGRPLSGPSGPVTSLAFSPTGGDILASGSRDAMVRLWDAAARQLLGPPLGGHSAAVNSLAFSPDGRTLASGSLDHTVRLWDVPTRQPAGQPLAGHTDSVEAVTFSHDGKILASASQDSTIILWDAATQRPLGAPLPGYQGYGGGLVFSLDGRTLAAASAGSFIDLWDVATHTALGEPLIRQHTGVTGMALSPDGTLLASASQDGTVVLWDLATRRVVGQPLTGHSGSVTSVAFSPDGRMLASGGEDKTVRLWDVATGQPVGLPFAEHTAAVTSVAFSPDGQTLASGSEDGAILLWDVSLASWQARACTNAGRNLSRAEWAQYLPGQPYHKTCEQWPDGP